MLLALPVNESTRNHLVTLLGILITAIITLSSTTLMGNAMAGFMLRMVSNFKPGDFLLVESHFGRVSEQGVFHTEIQTKERNLVTLPNLYLATKPLTVIRSSGTVVSATVSLGYDVSHNTVELILTEAATKAGLKDPFVQILELGDFSILYRCAGILEDTKFLLGAESELRAEMLDFLHENNVEIVSPAFMNQRVFPKEQIFIPDTSTQLPTGWTHISRSPKQDLIFDKATQAASIDQMKQHLAEYEDEKKQLDLELSSAKTEDEKKEITRKLERNKTRTGFMKERIRLEEEKVQTLT
jgi:hypothetical protein